MAPKKSSRRELEERLGYRFEDRSLLEEALIHASARSEQGGRDNERLEFLGDRVLGLSIAGMVFRRFPDASEADFARYYNKLVCKEACAEVAVKLGLGSQLVMAPSEAKTGGRRKDVILADACEAILGAIYVDGGYGAAQTVIKDLWQPLLETTGPDPDAKTALQEYAQSRRRGLPKYTEIERSGADHAPRFVVEVTVEGLKPAQGVGPSIKKAQQAAARALLLREAIWAENHDYGQVHG